MVEYYVTKGKLELTNGNPTVVVNGDAKALSQSEFILWTGLHWSILNKESLKASFDRKKKECHIFDDVSFEKTLERLKTRELIASKSDYLAADALYNLIKNLYIVPVGVVTELKRKILFLYMLFIKGVPLKECRSFAENFKISDLEKQVVIFTKRFKVSPAELIRIDEKNLWSISSENEIVSLAYKENENTSILENDTRFSDSKSKMISAIVNLYLKKQIIFE